MKSRTRSTILTALLALIAAASPAFAQTDAPAGAPVPAITAPVTFAPKQFDPQGIGIFVQGGFTKATAFDAGTSGSFMGQQGSLSGFIVGAGFGGNKSGFIGFGADVNIMTRGGEMFFGDLTTTALNIPVYARFNFMGRESREAATAYAIVGGALDFMMSAKLDDMDVKDAFNTFQPGMLFGAGFEMKRIAAEFRLTFSPSVLAEDEDGNYWFGLSDFRQATIVILFRYRIR